MVSVVQFVRQAVLRENLMFLGYLHYNVTTTHPYCTHTSPPSVAFHTSPTFRMLLQGLLVNSLANITNQKLSLVY